jgi:hypothetical protein
VASMGYLSINKDFDEKKFQKCMKYPKFGATHAASNFDEVKKFQNSKFFLGNC